MSVFSFCSGLLGGRAGADPTAKGGLGEVFTGESGEVKEGLIDGFAVLIVVAVAVLEEAEVEVEEVEVEVLGGVIDEVFDVFGVLGTSLEELFCD